MGASNTQDDIILTVRNLTKEFKGFVAVNGVDLDIKRGSVHALIGPNGAGKTTCFNLLTRFLRPTAGTIVFNGRDITQVDAADIARHAASNRVGCAVSLQSREHCRSRFPVCDCSDANPSATRAACSTK
jgi:ABC-type branched-subunit amino acid transport system ATPase component